MLFLGFSLHHKRLIPSSSGMAPSSVSAFLFVIRSIAEFDMPAGPAPINRIPGFIFGLLTARRLSSAGASWKAIPHKNVTEQADVNVELARRHR